MTSSKRSSPAARMILAVALLLPGGAAMSYQQPDYEVLYTDGDVEYRQYDSYLVSETVIENARDADAASSEGFRRLFRYITGANQSRSRISMKVRVAQAESEKIAMTVPVQQSATEAGWRVSFVMPADYTLETAPQPTDSRIYVREVPGRLMAVRRFAGRWTERNYVANEAALLAEIEEAGVEPNGVIERAAYNAPFSLPFLRRNEVMVPVAGLPVDAVVAAEETAVEAY